MGVLKVDLNTGASVANNSNYLGGAVKTPPSPNTSYSMDLPKRIAEAGLSRFLPKPLQWGALLAKNASDLYVSAQNGVNDGAVSEVNDFDAFGTNISSDISAISDMLSQVEQTNSSSQEAFQEQIDSTAPAVGDTLLSVLSQNGASFTTSMSLFSDVFSNKMDTMNSALTGLLIYFNDYMNLKTEQIPLQIEALRYNIATQGENLSPRDTEYYKNLSVYEKNEFYKNAVSDELLNATNIQGLSPREIQVSKHSYDIESKEFAKAPQTIYDLDGQVVVNLAPREAQMAMNATVAKDTTDKINYELDDDDISSILPADISTIFGYSGDSEVLQKFYNGLGGQGVL